MVSIGSNSVTFIDTTTNAVKHVAYVGRSPHEAFFTPDGRGALGHGPRRGLRRRARRRDLPGEEPDQAFERSRDDGLFVRREVWLRLLELYSGDIGRIGCRP